MSEAYRDHKILSETVKCMYRLFVSESQVTESLHSPHVDRRCASIHRCLPPASRYLQFQLRLTWNHQHSILFCMHVPCRPLSTLLQTDFNIHITHCAADSNFSTEVHKTNLPIDCKKWIGLNVKPSPPWERNWKLKRPQPETLSSANPLWEYAICISIDHVWWFNILQP
jgi:hypothetical protein